MKKKKFFVISIFILVITIALGLLLKFKTSSDIPLVSSLVDIDKYYGKDIKVRGKLNFSGKINFVQLENGERLAVCCEVEPEFHQQWVEIMGVLEPPKKVEANMPVGAQYTGTILHIKQIKKIQTPEADQRVMLKGYVDSAARRAYQQIITAYIGDESYPNVFYFYVGENKQVDFDRPEVMALVTEEGKFISESVYDQEVTISGIKREGKICYWVGKTWKGDQEGEEKCHKMPVVIVDDILDQENFSLILTKIIGYKPEFIYQHPQVCPDFQDHYFDIDKFGQIPVCYPEKIDCNKVEIYGRLKEVNIECPEDPNIPHGKCPYHGYYLIAETVNCIE